MLIREVPIFVLSHKNSRVLGGWEGGKGKGRWGGGGEGWVCVCVEWGGCGSGGGVMGVGGRWREGSRGCIKYAWKSKKISLEIIGVVTEGLKQHCLP